MHFCCIFIHARPPHCEPRLLILPQKAIDQPKPMKIQRHNAIRDLLASSAVPNQDELRRKLRRRGFAVTQATLSRDIHELRLSKGPGGYSLPHRNGANGSATATEDDSPPSVAEVIESFGLRVRQAMNQVVMSTVMGGAQPVAAALDYEAWPEVVGTVAGDDTVLVICPDPRRAGEVEARLRTMLES
jgi:transcriptional regulator of arginine metabolism